MSKKYNNETDGKKVPLSVRIDPKLNYILTIIGKIDRITKSEIVERAFWGDGGEGEWLDISGEKKDESDVEQVEEVRRIVDYISRYKVNISVYIDKELNDIISNAAKEREMSKVNVIENVLWEYVEKEGFERDPVSDKMIKITIDLPGRFKEYMDIAE